MNLTGLWHRDDPLLKYLLEQYHLNLLSVPRENATVGDLYIRKGNSKEFFPPSKIAAFLEPEFQLPKITINETMANVVGKVSKGMSANVGLQFVEAFIGQFSPKIEAVFGEKNTQVIQFTFTNPTRDYIDPQSLQSEFGKYHVKENNSSLIEEGHRYYISTGVIKSSSISINATDDKKRTVDVKGEIQGLVNASGNISVKQADDGLITFEGNKKLAFGLEICELKYNDITKRFKLETFSEPISFREAGEQKIRYGPQKAKPIVIASPEDEDPFISVSPYT